MKKIILVFAAFFFVVLVIPVTIHLIRNKDNQSVRFYYPDTRYRGLKAEKRTITIRPGQGSREEILIREYLLGPINYNYIYPVQEDLVQDIKKVQGKTTDMMIINFKPGFSAYALQNYDAVNWLLQGIIQTLKDNTRVKALYIRENNDRIRLQVGDWQLYYPVKFK